MYILIKTTKATSHYLKNIKYLFKYLFTLYESINKNHKKIEVFQIIYIQDFLELE